MKGREKLCAKLSSAFLRKWWFVVAASVGIILFGVIVIIFFSSWVNLVINHEVTLRNGSQSFGWWAKPPVVPMIKVYIYNVTNADEFLNNGSKPVVDELGPYVYVEKWEKKNIKFHDNGTVSFNQEKIYTFDESLSAGLEDDVVVVPNIPMLSATSQSKHAARFLRLAMASIMDILKIKPFVEVSVGQLLWGYEDPLLKLAKDVVPKEQKLPYEEFGLMYNKNGTSKDTVTLFTGAADITKYGLIDKFNGQSHLTHYTSDKCNSLMGSDGSIFPPHLTKNSTIYVYDKDLCRILPLVYEKTVKGSDDIPAFRFTPPLNVFGDVDENPENLCFCPHGPPCAPSGFFNVSLCQYDSPILLSFPHFYLANDSYRTALDGITPPEPEKHKFYIDVQPVMGTAMSAKARVQINLAVSQVVDIKQVATFPDIIFPIMWFEEGLDGLPKEMTGLMGLATTVPPIARAALAGVLFVMGAVLLLIAVWRLVRGANRLSSLHLAPGHVGPPTNKNKDVPMGNVPRN
ncbi:scavenger receptor class B member 1 isoform X1 [Tribolium castaneum]|uniref:Scavenger receptor class B member 1 n=1 Tax=Tribolium castaneum TaxID=7070 RepID=D2A3S6_TRICA|nr:PREDICTED: scavenger receptor class B member 1 isoform X1 [Tribolium castaneum]EFA05670.1 Protein croquemort-like Protein [Tribolium castaneum]|eukprot:XP_966331.1 PREDICTED: scavenger receptor class B member 1 isoform X1 [Tribolium castaneum]